MNKKTKLNNVMSLMLLAIFPLISSCDMYKEMKAMHTPKY